MQTLGRRLGWRLMLWAGGVSALILADEWLKEGYLFQPSDLLKLGTHESLLAALWLATLAFTLV
ncbi:MAG: hypothetical protein QW057_02245, partial [Candidatus Bathyarchaeia archaeon]